MNNLISLAKPDTQQLHVIKTELTWHPNGIKYEQVSTGDPSAGI